MHTLEAAMHDEMDYRESLRRHLIPIEKLDARVLARVRCERLRLRLALDFATSNEREIIGGRLTDELGRRKEQVIARGSGAETTY